MFKILPNLVTLMMRPLNMALFGTKLQVDTQLGSNHLIKCLKPVIKIKHNLWLFQLQQKIVLQYCSQNKLHLFSHEQQAQDHWLVDSRCKRQRPCRLARDQS